MNAALNVKPITVKVLQAPDYENARIDCMGDWIEDNKPLLQEYWDDLGMYCEEPLDPVADKKEFEHFCIRQHENTSAYIDEQAEEWALEARDERRDAWGTL